MFSLYLHGFSAGTPSTIQRHACLATYPECNLPETLKWISGKKMDGPSNHEEIYTNQSGNIHFFLSNQ